MLESDLREMISARKGFLNLQTNHLILFEYLVNVKVRYEKYTV